jgi:hypothetical protein
MSNTLEWSQNDDGSLRATVRSEHTTDIGANIADPKAEIRAIADLAGLEVNIIDPEPDNG